MNTIETVFFIGKPGCGKGTQAKLLSARTNWPIIASGQQFRSIAAEDTPVGRKVKSEIDAGLLAPHWFAMYLYQKALFSLPEGSSVIFDGFNRKVPEARLIIDSLAWLNRPFHVLHIAISDAEVEKRLALRRETEHRADDYAVEERLKEYVAFTEPALALFRESGVLVEINGEQSPDVIAEDIAHALELS